MVEIPTLFTNRMAARLGEEFLAFDAALQEPPAVGLRLNTLKSDPLQVIQSPVPIPLNELRPVPWCPAGFFLSGEQAAKARLGAHPYHAAGLYYLQDPAAMAVAEIAAPQPGERVLDLAAAPGGKATHLASLMENQGLLLANEIHSQRVWDLAENLERWGAINTVITNSSPDQLASQLTATFDLVVVDAPCSGEGMFRKSEAARQEWKMELVSGCAMRQEGILEAAAAMVRPGGRLVYSTCTFAAEENEGVIGRFLENNPDFFVRPVSANALFSPGRPTWAGMPADHPISGAVRLWPHLHPGEGHFAAVLGRRAGRPVEPQPPFDQRLPNRSTRELLDEFLEATFQNLDIWFAGDRLHQHRQQLFLLPEKTIDMAGLRLIRPGLWLGTVKKNRFEPAHTLAMALPPSWFRARHNLAAADQETTAFRHGDLLEAAGTDGWLLVTVDGFGLGWGKRVKNRIKNHYPKGLRVWAKN